MCFSSAVTAWAEEGKRWIMGLLRVEFSQKNENEGRCL